MKIDYLFAAMMVKDLKKAEAFYTKVLGREPDDRPMATLVQWRGFSKAGVQLFQDAKNSGGGRMTVVVRDVEKVRATFDQRGIALGKTIPGDFGKIAQLSDPDGNLITFAEPPQSVEPTSRRTIEGKKREQKGKR